jgi:hypothetical protein
MSAIPQLMSGRALEHGIAMHVDHGGTGSAKMYVGGQANAQVAAGTAHTNSTDETALSSYTIPANTLVAGSTIRVWAWGIATATNSTDTLTTALRLGTSATITSNELIYTSAAIDSVNNDIFCLQAVIQVRTAGATGTAVAMISYQDPDLPGTAPKWNVKGSFTLNTTDANFLELSADWSVANAGNSCRSDMFVVDIVNPDT